MHCEFGQSERDNPNRKRNETQEALLTHARRCAPLPRALDRRSLGNASLLEEMMVMQRRIMLGGMRDPTATVLTIVVTGFEEALLRCTMVYRDEFWDWVMGKPEPTEAEIRSKRLIQAASAASGMRIEVTSIITSRLAYLLMRPHRFAFNFGYGFDANDDGMTGAAFLFAAMFLELGLEVAIDSAALGIEQM